MAFQQYNSAALKKRREKYEKRLKKMTTRQSKKEHERQKRSFLLESPNVISRYDPITSGEGDRGLDKKRTGSIYTPEPKVDDRMSPDIQKALFRPIKVQSTNPMELILKGRSKKETPRSARKMYTDLKKTAKIYRKKKKGAPHSKKSIAVTKKGGKRKRRKNKRSKKRRGKKRKTRNTRKKRR